MNERINEFKAIAIFGNIGSGKTALAYRLLRYFKKPIYFLKHPNPQLIEKLFDYQNIYAIEDMANLQDCVVYCDELQLFGSQYKREQILSKILSLARQRNITIIFSSSDTRTFSSRIEAYFDMWIIKDIEYQLTKQRGMIRSILENNCIVTPSEVKLAPNEYILSNRRYPEWNGKGTFELIPEWSDLLSKPFIRPINLVFGGNCKKNGLKKRIKKTCEKKSQEVTLRRIGLKPQKAKKKAKLEVEHEE